jgi:uncharacterized membrane protein
MTERVYRMVLGGMLWLALVLSAYLETTAPMYIVIALLFFEGITNWRVPVIITRIKYGERYKEYLEAPACATRWFGTFDAERMLRFIVAFLLLFSLHIATDITWFMPWLFAAMLILAGITNICPMVMLLRWAGLR